MTKSKWLLFDLFIAKKAKLSFCMWFSNATFWLIKFIIKESPKTQLFHILINGHDFRLGDGNQKWDRISACIQIR